MTEKFSLRDELFNPKKVTYLAALIKSVYADFKDKNQEWKYNSIWSEYEYMICSKEYPQNLFGSSPRGSGVKI
jgi:hypothetical protein